MNQQLIQELQHTINNQQLSMDEMMSQIHGLQTEQQTLVIEKEQLLRVCDEQRQEKTKLIQQEQVLTEQLQKEREQGGI